ncbi:MAG TPA: biotin/lipoyl-containing protein [Candidatus Acidoferrales bacterium]|nr:biotin/lipoyl-containing protein [Candidatus Acidoferrales bacterium]
MLNFLDGREVAADLVEVQPGVYSVLIGGQAFEASVTADSTSSRVMIGEHEFPFEVVDPRRWNRGRRGVAGAEGKQSIIAPMPGKIVRLLVKNEDSVEIGQGLIVVEAMKMQNEIKSPKAGKIERLDVKEGQAVNAGEILAVIA